MTPARTAQRDILQDPFPLSPSEKLRSVIATLERINTILNTLGPQESSIRLKGTCGGNFRLVTLEVVPSWDELDAKVSALQGFQQEVARCENKLKELEQAFPAEVKSAATTIIPTKDRITVLLQEYKK